MLLQGEAHYLLNGFGINIDLKGKVNLSISLYHNTILSILPDQLLQCIIEVSNITEYKLDFLLQ